MKNTIYLLTLITLLTSCSKELTTPLDSEKIAVVESYLVAGDSTITVNVSKLLPFSTDTNEVKEYISGLQLQINGYNIKETSTGIYQLKLKNACIEPGITYELKFRYYDDSVTSSTVIPEKPANFALSETILYTDRITSSSTGFGGGPMEDIEVTWDNDDDSYYYLMVEYLESTPDYINYLMEDLDISLNQSEAPVQSAGARIGMRNLNFFGHYRVVLFKVNKDFADLYQHLTSNSNNLTNPVTAITNGYGVFTGMSSDTAFIEVREN